MADSEQNTDVSVMQRRVDKLVTNEPHLKNFFQNAEVTAYIRQPELKTIDVIVKLLTAYAERPALGWRAYDLVKDPNTGKHSIQYRLEFNTMSYQHLHGLVQSLANIWNSDSRYAVGTREFVATLGFVSADFVLIDIACVFNGVVSVPLQTNMSIDALTAILDETATTSLFSSLETIENAVALCQKSTTIKSLVVIDYEPRDDTQRERYDWAGSTLENAGVAIATLQDLLEAGKVLAPVAPATSIQNDDLVTLLYTSGTSGTPKGAMFSDRLFKRCWTEAGLDVPVITLAYQPFNHGFGRLTINRTLSRGGVCYFAAKSDMTTLFEDVRLTRPTSFGFVPRIAETIYDHYQSEVSRRLSCRENEHAIRAEVMQEMRTSFLGDRLLLGVVGGAPTAPEISKFMTDCFLVPLVDGYGTTEAGVISFAGIVQRPPVIDYKLIDVPELDYYVTDKPYPRGELLVKTEMGISGYFKNAEMTAKLFTSDGYMITGDIVENRGPDRIAVVDRRNNVLKLAQGEFVAISRLEGIFSAGDPLISQIFLYGSSTRSYLLGVVVPDLVLASARLGHDPDMAELKQLLRAAIKSIAQSQQLRAYEVPRDFIVETEPFSAARGLLTEIGKNIRPRFKARYGETLESLYTEIAERQRGDLESLRHGDAEASVFEIVHRTFEATLGLVNIDLSNHQSFTELGGDSLVAVSMSLRLEEKFSIKVPVGLILAPTASVQNISTYIEDALSGKILEQVSFESVHGDSPTVVNAADFSLHKFIPDVLISKPVMRRQQFETTVLLTGATGFLGRFLCLYWLEQLVPLGGKVICLIRAQDDSAARLRLDAVFGKGDQALLQRFNELARGHLEVLAGDLSAPHLGLDESVFERLSVEVDSIIHCAALVNHMLSYRQLFEPNVLGTAEVIRLALTGRLKRVDYVSSMAAAGLDPENLVGEDEDIRIACPAWPAEGGYALGYAISKWAGEVMLLQAHELTGLQVNVYRGDMLLAHRLYAGQINVPDMFTRLLYSVVRTGMAPSSFYEKSTGGENSRPHYNGLPVDFVAKTMVAIAVHSQEGFTTYNFDNPHDDGISLDRIIDWITESGYQITRISDYHDWFLRFEEQLKLLPEKQRSQSSLAIIGQMRDPIPVSVHFKCDVFKEKVRQLATDPSGGIPQLSLEFIQKNLNDMIVLNMIEDRRVN